MGERKAGDVNWVDADTWRARLATKSNPTPPCTATSTSSLEIFRFLELANEIRNCIYLYYMVNAKESCRTPIINRHNTYHDSFGAIQIGAYDEYTTPELRDQCGRNNSISEELWYGHPEVHDRNALFCIYQNHLTRPLMPHAIEPALTRACYEIRAQCLPMWYHQFTTILRLSRSLDHDGGLYERQTMQDVVEPDTMLDKIHPFTDNQLRLMGSLRFATDQAWSAGYDPFKDHRQWLAIAQFLKVSVATGLEFEAFHQSIRGGMPMFVPLKEKKALVACNNINGMQPTEVPERFWDGLTARSVEQWTSMEFFQFKVDQSEAVIRFILEALRDEQSKGEQTGLVHVPTKAEVAKLVEARVESAKQSDDVDST